MTNINKKFLAPGGSINPFLSMAEAGVSPKKIKAFVISELSPYFENVNVVEELAVDILTPEVLNLHNVKMKNNEYLLEYVLGIYRSAQGKNRDASAQICANSEQAVIDGLSHYMSLFLTETPKTELGLYEYTLDIFKIIGTVIEGCLKPLLFELLLQQRISRNKNFNIVQPPKLGVMVQELYDTIEKKELMAPEPWGIRLSQWRNIAQHHNTKIEVDAIICSYGEAHNRKEVVLSRDELGCLAQKVMSIFNVIKLARTIFFIDNLTDITPYLEEIDMREDSRVVSFATAISTQGFKLNNLSLSDNSAVAKIVDLQEPSQKRHIHASQFLIPLWHDTKRKELVIEYVSECGKSTAKFSVAGSACENLANEVIDIEEYINLVNFSIEPNKTVHPTN